MLLLIGVIKHKLRLITQFEKFAITETFWRKQMVMCNNRTIVAQFDILQNPMVPMENRYKRERIQTRTGNNRQLKLTRGRCRRERETNEEG